MLSYVIDTIAPAAELVLVGDARVWVHDVTVVCYSLFVWSGLPLTAHSILLAGHVLSTATYHEDVSPGFRG